MRIGITSRKSSGFTSCSESERRIVNVESEEFMLEDGRPMTGGKFMGDAKVTNVQVEYKNNSKLWGLT